MVVPNFVLELELVETESLGDDALYKSACNSLYK